MTAQDIINSALRKAGVLAAGESPTAQESVDTLTLLNDMLDSWSAERLTIFTVTRQTFHLVANQQAYTMGSGGDFNVPRPPRIEYISVISLQNTAQPLEIPITMLTDAQWQAIPVKNIQSSLPLNVWDDGGFPLRTLSYWCIPNTAVDTAIYTWTALNQFASLGTSYTFPPGYARAIRFNLAVEACAEFNEPLDPNVAKIALDSKVAIKSQNAPILDLQVDEALIGRPRTYNWLTDNANIRSGGY